MTSKDSTLSLNLCNISGIPIRIHLSFFLLLGWVAFEEFQRSGQPIQEVLFIVAIFACVLLHELGHALMAKRYNIKTRDIVLYPFGGIAALMGQAKPFPELLIAVAGPLVNVVIAAALYFILDFSTVEEMLVNPGILTRIFIANVFLVVFNMIPAFPMDGGRILRATLQLLKIPHATKISSRLSQILSILMGLAALYSGNILLLIIAVVVFMNAVQEHAHDRAQVLAEGFSVRNVMIDAEHLIVFHHGMTISQALAEGIKSHQPYFPVLLGSSVLGIVNRSDLIDAATMDEESYVSGLMDRELAVIGPHEPLPKLLELFETRGGNAVIIMEGDRFAGMVTKEKLLEFLLVNGLRRERERLGHEQSEFEP